MQEWFGLAGLQPQPQATPHLRKIAASKRPHLGCFKWPWQPLVPKSAMQLRQLLRERSISAAAVDAASTLHPDGVARQGLTAIEAATSYHVVSSCHAHIYQANCVEYAHSLSVAFSREVLLFQAITSAVQRLGCATQSCARNDKICTIRKSKGEDPVQIE